MVAVHAHRVSHLPRFKKAALPVFKKLYGEVKSGREAARVIKVCGAKDYPKKVASELKAIRESEMWKAGAAVRSLRPKEKADLSKAAKAKGTTGRAG